MEAEPLQLRFARRAQERMLDLVRAAPGDGRPRGLTGFGEVGKPDIGGYRVERHGRPYRSRLNSCSPAGDRLVRWAHGGYSEAALARDDHSTEGGKGAPCRRQRDERVTS